MDWRKATDEEAGCLLVVGRNTVGNNVELLPVDAGVQQEYPTGVRVMDADRSKFCFGKEHVFYMKDGRMFDVKIEEDGTVLIKR